MTWLLIVSFVCFKQLVKLDMCYICAGSFELLSMAGKIKRIVYMLNMSLSFFYSSGCAFNSYSSMFCKRFLSAAQAIQ